MLLLEQWEADSQVNLDMFLCSGVEKAERFLSETGHGGTRGHQRRAVQHEGPPGLAAQWYVSPTHTHTLLAGMKQVTRELQYWSLVLLLSTFTQGHPWHLAISSPSTHALFCYAARPNYSAALLMRTNCAIVGANGFPDGYPGACQACSLNHWPNAQARLW